jgi:hypothetical protein
VVIAYGTFNAVLGVLAGAAIVVSPTTAAYLTGETGVFTPLALMIVSWILTRRSAVARCTGSLTPPSNCCAGACGCSMQSWHAAQPTRESGRFAPHSHSGPVLAALRSGPHVQRAMPGLHPSEPYPAAQLAARGLYARQARNTALAAFASDLPAPVMADLLVMRINTAVTWGQTVKRDWYSFAAAKIEGQHADSGTRDPVT